MTVHEEKQLMLRVVLGIAKAQLETVGGLTPFGATLGTKRDVQLLMPESMKKDVKQDELDSYWGKQLRRIIAGQDCKTVCTCADVRLPNGQGKLVPGVLIHIEHEGSDAEDIFVPYTKDKDSKVIFGSETRKNSNSFVFVSPGQPSEEAN